MMAKRESLGSDIESSLSENYAMDELTRALMDKRDTMYLHVLAGMQPDKAARFHDFIKLEDELIKITRKKAYISGYSDCMSFINSLCDNE